MDDLDLDRARAARARADELRERAKAAEAHSEQLARRLRLIPDPWLPTAEAAIYSDCGQRTIERAIEHGHLHAGGSPRHRLIKRSELDRWINSGMLTALAILLALALLAFVFGDDLLDQLHHIIRGFQCC